jgi:hypothetical protein
MREKHSLSPKVLGKPNIVTRHQPRAVVDSMEYGKKRSAIIRQNNLLRLDAPTILRYQTDWWVWSIAPGRTVE